MTYDTGSKLQHPEISMNDPGAHILSAQYEASKVGQAQFQLLGQ
jgi:hypothetical protein